MKALVCIDLDRAIGFEGGLLFRLPEDLAFYKRSTLGKTVVMGRNTLLSMPRSKPLPGRNNLVLSASMEERDEELKGGFRFAVRNTPERALEYLRENGLFDEAVLSFFSDLSAMLRTDRTYPDIATFGFWCRKAALMQEKEKYDDLAERFGKGTVLHSTPSNVPVNFAFSFAAGLLAGNANIVRLPAKDFPQVTVICDAIRTLLANQHSALAPYVCFVKFPPDKEITDMLSARCAVRVIWGGDATVAEIRRSPLPPRAGEITFADRHSAAVIDADAYLCAENKDLIVQNFYNDTYYTDQNACTSPRFVFWQGAHTAEAKADFWERVHRTVREKYTL
ncbi:MAG: dihydrofolate reductase, partial [Firmicutes bacterium]|nr:dihydrofolate reductase [Bacillota bacterium]